MVCFMRLKLTPYKVYPLNILDFVCVCGYTYRIETDGRVNKSIKCSSCGKKLKEVEK